MSLNEANMPQNKPSEPGTVDTNRNLTCLDISFQDGEMESNRDNTSTNQEPVWEIQSASDRHGVDIYSLLTRVSGGDKSVDNISTIIQFRYDFD